MPQLSRDQYRDFLKDTIRQQIDFSQTDQYTGMRASAPGKTLPGRRQLLGLPPAGQWKGIETIDLVTAIGDRQSRRNFSPEPLTLDELSFLLWATQGVRQQAT